MQALPSFSAVVEWENARLAGTERATEMLREFLSQTTQLYPNIDGRPELIILYEEGVVARDVVEAALAAACPAEAPVDVCLHGTKGSSYYGQKNIGARLASRDYLLFVDSDVVPEPGWLRALLSSLGREVKVVGGSTYVDPGSFLGRAFGLFWFFPLRLTSGGLRESSFFYANNVIFERDLFLAYEFPDLPLYRGHCGVLGARLRQNGIRLFLRSDARVSHAPPTPGQFVHRALSEGYDVAVRARLASQPSALGSGELLHHFRNMRTRVSKRRNQLKLGLKEYAAALTLASAYALLRFAGQQWAARSPERAGKILGITSDHQVLSFRSVSSNPLR